MNEEEFADAVLDVTDGIAAMLLVKNESYGNSALDPVRIFSKADTVEQLKVRIDDKLSRLQRGNDAFPEDTVMDLIGYLVLLLIAQGPEETEAEVPSLLDWDRELLEDQGVPIHEPEVKLPTDPPLVGVIPEHKRAWSVPDDRGTLIGEVLNTEVSYEPGKLPKITGDIVINQPPQPGTAIYLINNTGAARA